MRVLLAEDDDDIAHFIGRGLAEAGHHVSRFAEGDSALLAARTESFDVIVLDRMLPKIEGLDVLRRIRGLSIQTPVMILTAKSGVADRVEGFDAGADDYLAKPFALTELIARLAALARRPPIHAVMTYLTVGDIEMDILRREVRRANRPIHLQPREFSLLEVLMRNPGRIVTRSMFLEIVWGFNFDPQTNIVESHMSRMRTKLRGTGNVDLVETIRGSGYRLRDDA